MRSPDTSDVTVNMTDEERDFFDALKCELGIERDANCLRIALWHLAKWANVPIGGQTWLPRGENEERKLKAIQRQMRQSA